MRVAITGANGLVGTMLCEKLAKKHEIVKIDRQNCNILDKKKLLEKTFKADIIVHLAAELDEEAKDLFKVNVEGTENVLEAASQNQVKQFIFLSTVGVYGSTPGLKDENTPINPETEYEKTKAEAEKKVLNYQELFYVTILRPALIAGKNKYWQSIIETIKKNYPLIGSGENEWQMACAEDVCDAIEYSISNPDFYGETFIVAEKKPMKLRQIAELIRKELGMTGDIKTIPYWLGMIIAQANRILNFNKILKPSYLKRMNRQRLYSTKKLEQAGFAAKQSASECIKKIVKEIK